MNKPKHARSSVIRDFDYDDDRRKLYVTFVSGKTYVYDGVPHDTYHDFATASSKGEFFNAHIKNHYPFALAASWPAGVRH
jgi:KTSC domain